jgi:signal transduction histidine kinase
MSLTASAQQNVIDSLKRSIAAETVDSSRTKLKLQLVMELRYSGDTMYMPLVEEAIHECRDQNRQDLLVRAYMEKGIYHETRSNKDSARYYFELGKSISDDRGLLKESGYALFHLAGLARYSGEHRLAYDTYGQAMEVFKELEMAPQVATLTFSQAVILDNMGRFEESTTRFYDALHAYEDLEDDYGIGNCYNSLGLMVQRTSDYDRSMKLYRTALRYMSRAGIKSQICNILDNIGVIHRLQNNIDSAIHYSQLALTGRRDIGDDYGVGRGMINLAEDYRALKQYDKAADQLESSISIFERSQDPQSMSLALSRLSQILNLQGKGKDAIEYARKAVDLARKSGSLNEESSAQKNLSSIYESQGHHLLALEHFKIHDQLSDSILNAANLANLNELQTRYESVKKDQLILEQDLNLKTTEAALSEKTFFNRLIGITLIGVLLALALIIMNFRQRSKLNQEKLINLEQQKTVATMEAMIAGEERERSRIAKDLHDGLNGTLATVKMYLGGLPDEAPALNQSERFEKMKGILNDTTEEVRRISHDLMPQVLTREGLIAALETYCAHINSTDMLTVELLSTGLEERLGERFELTLYRVIQELMNNIIKHAHATEVTLQLFRLENKLQVTVEDDGVGFDPGKAALGLGLESIRSRVEMLDGHSEIDSRPGKGTTVHMEFELTNTSKRQ